MQKQTETTNTALFIRRLQELGNAERAIADQRYHKSSREHWGVSVAGLQNALDKFDMNELIAFVEINTHHFTFLKNDVLQPTSMELYQAEIAILESTS